MSFNMNICLVSIETFSSVCLCLFSLSSPVSFESRVDLTASVGGFSVFLNRSMTSCVAASLCFSSLDSLALSPSSSDALCPGRQIIWLGQTQPVKAPRPCFTSSDITRLSLWLQLVKILFLLNFKNVFILRDHPSLECKDLTPHKTDSWLPFSGVERVCVSWW